MLGSISCAHAPDARLKPRAPSAQALAAPRLVAPPEGAVLTFFPRNIEFEWAPVDGAVKYTIEVDCYLCCAPDRWCSDVAPNRTTRSNVAGTRFTSDGFPGDQPGRWRVWATDARGRAGFASAWREFTFRTASLTPAPAGSTFRTPDGLNVSGPGAAAPRPIYHPNPPYPAAASKDRVTGEVMMQAVVDANGRVQDVRVLRSLRQDLDQAAVDTFRQWRFEPARKDGQPMAAQITVTMTFNLK